MNDKIRELSERFNEKIQQLKDDQSGRGHLTKEARAFFDDLKIKSAEKQAIYDKVNAINAELLELENKKQKAEKKLHPKYNKLDILDKGIAEIEKRL